MGLQLEATGCPNLLQKQGGKIKLKRIILKNINYGKAFKRYDTGVHERMGPLFWKGKKNEKI